MARTTYYHADEVAALLNRPISDVYGMLPKKVYQRNYDLEKSLQINLYYGIIAVITFANLIIEFLKSKLINN